MKDEGKKKRASLSKDYSESTWRCSDISITFYYIHISLIQNAWNKIGQFLSNLQVDCQRWMYTIGSAFYSQSIHEIAELNVQFVLWFGLQTSDNGGKCQTQFFTLCVPVWERRLGGGEKVFRKDEGRRLIYCLPPARRAEAILQTFLQVCLWILPS